MSNQIHPLTGTTEKPDDVFNAELAAQMAKRTDKLSDNTIDLAIRLKQAREFMAWSCSHIRGSWLDWMDAANKASADVSHFRMHFDRESKAVIATAKDVTGFFNSEEYSKALLAMRDTMAMLERFGELKRNGTLDAFADFILKVSCK